MRRTIAAACTIATLTGCADAPADAARGWVAETDTVGDTIVVRTVSGSAWGDSVRLVPEMSVGVEEGDDAYMFGRVRALAVRQNGELLVLDGQVPVLRRYSPDGAHVGDIGREGGGPGEYRRPETVDELPDGRIVVRDPGNGRFEVWSADLQSQPSWRLSSGLSTGRQTYVDTAGHVHTLILLESGVSVDQWRYGLAHFTPSGEHTDTLIVPTWDYEAATVTGSSEGGSSSQMVPFTGQIRWSYSPHGYFVGGTTDRYAVDLYRPDGVLRLARAAEPVAVLPQEAAEREAQITRNMQNNFGAWRWNGPPIPETKTPWKDLFVDADGRVWVHVSMPGEDAMTDEEALEQERQSGQPVVRWEEPPVFDLFDPDGRYLARIALPEGAVTWPWPVVRGDSMWLIVADELGVQRVVRYRIERPSGAGSESAS